MKNIVSKNPRIAALLTVALVSTAPSLAQTYPKEGNFDYVSCFSGTTRLMTFSKTHTAWTSEYSGTNRSEKSASPFDNTTFRCIAFVASMNGKRSGNSMCETSDRDGDKYLTYFNQAGDGSSTREAVAGTGKFEGLATKGVTAPLGPFPSIDPGMIQSCVHQTGTYKMK